MEEAYVDVFWIDNVAILRVLDKVGLLLIITDQAIEFSRARGYSYNCALHSLGAKG